MQLESYFKNPHFDLFELQKQAVEETLKKITFLIRGEAGSGKTIITVYLIKIWLTLGLIKNVLILTKNEVLHKYKKDLLDHIPFLRETDIKVMENNEDRQLFDTQAKIYICDYNQVKLVYTQYAGKLPSKSERKRTIIKKVFPVNKDWAVVMDEGQACKNLKSDIHKIIYKNVRDAVSKVITSGTPIEKPEEYFALFRILNEKLLGSFHFFMRDLAVLRKGTYAPIYYKESGLRKLNQKISPYMMTVYKDDIREIPKKTITDIEVEFTPDFLAEYDIEKANLQRVAYREGRAFYRKVATLIQPIYNKIKEIREDNPRFAKFDSMLRRFIASEKVIVWERSPSVMNRLSEYYKDKGIENLVIHGEVDKYDRTRLISLFNTESKYRILFISYLIGGEAWEIPSRPDCKRSIFYSIPDRDISFTQCINRQHRLNSESPVFIYRLVLKESIDEWARSLLDYKSKLNKGIIENEQYEDMSYASYERFLGIDKNSII